MPYYEFYCPANHRIYTFFARTLAHSGKLPRCPDNPDWNLEKRISRFAVVGRAKDPHAEGPDDLNDPRMEAAMAEMEREMAGIDEHNPDPRQLARMIRRMGEITGEPMADAMEEMIGRMEAGEDPETLEEKFGDALDDGGEGQDPDAPPEPAGKRLRRLAARARPPQRDDRVFEIEEWI